MEPVHHCTNNMLLVGDGVKVQTVPATMINNEDGSFNSISTFWRPTPKELELLNANGVVQLWVVSPQHPPVWVGAARG
jgi:hypothetical protein